MNSIQDFNQEPTREPILKIWRDINERLNQETAPQEEPTDEEKN